MDFQLELFTLIFQSKSHALAELDELHGSGGLRERAIERLQLQREDCRARGIMISWASSEIREEEIARRERQLFYSRRHRIRTQWRDYRFFPRSYKWSYWHDYAFSRDRGLCQICSREADEVHHILPRYLGGTDHPDNLISLCSLDHLFAPDEPLEFPAYRQNGGAVAYLVHRIISEQGAMLQAELGEWQEYKEEP